MKVAIVTLHRVYNFGSALQAYATQKFFEMLGCETEIIDYITPQRTKKRIFFTPAADVNMQGIRAIAYRFAKVGSLVLKEITFGGFVRRHLKLTRKYIDDVDLDANPPKADMYVTGSDQTWNSHYNERVDRGFWLDFLPVEARRISFASSFGKDRLDPKEIKTTKSYLSRYAGISVREDTARNIVSELGYEAVQLIDPTLLLSKEEWLKRASRRLVRERYLILMLLYNEDNHATEYARKIADEKGLTLVKISWEMKKPHMVDRLMTHRSPEDFLSLFANADFVVTNSFHGLAFSIKFEKEFVVVPRNEFYSRIDSLLKLTGLQSRLVNSEEQLRCIREPIDYLPIRNVLELEKERSIRFVQEFVKVRNLND